MAGVSGVGKGRKGGKGRDVTIQFKSVREAVMVIGMFLIGGLVFGNVNIEIDPSS